MSWSGTFLIGSDRDDWFTHRPLQEEGTRTRLLSVEAGEGRLSWQSGLHKTKVGPRRLPAFEIRTVDHRVHTFRATEVRPGEGLVDHYLCADPETHEIALDRGHTREWEHFMLVNPQECGWLHEIIIHGRLQTENGTTGDFEIVSHFRLKAGDRLFDLRRVLGVGDLPSAESGRSLVLADTNGRLCEIYLS